MVEHNDESIRAALLRLRAENERYRKALETIRCEYGKVCEGYEICSHTACDSSVGAWMEADAALRGATSHD